MAVILAVVLLFGGSAATVYAAQGSLPDQALYPVKTWSEDVLQSVTSSQQNRLNLLLDFSDRRLAEMTALQDAGIPIPSQVTDRFQQELDAVLVLVANMDNADINQALDFSQRRAEAALQKVSDLVAGLPSDPVILAVQARLEEQVLLFGHGRGDPQNFRNQVDKRFKGTLTAPGLQRQATDAFFSPTVGTSSSGTQGQGTPGPNQHGGQNPDVTPQPGGSSGNKP